MEPTEPSPESPAIEDDRLLVSIPETGRILSVGRTSVYGLIKKNVLQTIKIGSRQLVVMQSIRRLASPPSAKVTSGYAPIATVFCLARKR